MQRFVNNPDMIVDDMILGFSKAHKDTIHVSSENDHVIVKNDLVKGKVGIVSGGGSGHEPCFLGYVGKNMLDSVAVGEVFSSLRRLLFTKHLRKRIREAVLLVFLVIMQATI